MCKELLLICILKCSKFARWADILVTLFIATVKVSIQPPSHLITPSSDLEGYQDFQVSSNRIPKEPLAPPNLLNTPVILSKVLVKIFLAPPNLSYILGIASKILAEKLLVPLNISEFLVPPSSVSEPSINLSRVSKTPLVPLIHLSIITEGDLGPQHPMPQVRRKYKIFLGYEAAIDISSPTASSVTYSYLFASLLSSFFRSLSNNIDNSLATNLDSPSISRPIKLIITRKKNAQKEAKLADVVEKKAAIAAKKAPAAKTRKIQAVARKAEVTAQKVQKALEKKALKKEQAIKKGEKQVTKNVKTSIEKIQITKQKAAVPPKNSNAKKKKRQTTDTNIIEA